MAILSIFLYDLSKPIAQSFLAKLFRYITIFSDTFYKRTSASLKTRRPHKFILPYNFKHNKSPVILDFGLYQKIRFIMVRIINRNTQNNS